MWETIRILIARASLAFVLVGVLILLLTASGELVIGTFIYKIPDSNTRVVIGAVAILLILVGIWSQVSPDVGGINKLSAELAEFRLEWKSTMHPIDAGKLSVTVDEIGQKLDTAVKSILGEVRKQQRTFARAIEEKFQEQSKEAVRTLEAALRKELGSVVPGGHDRDRELLAARFAELLLHAMTQMGQYQRVNIDQRSAESLESVERGISMAIIGRETGRYRP
jgi:hypothetical protein